MLFLESFHGFTVAPRPRNVAFSINIFQSYLREGDWGEVCLQHIPRHIQTSNYNIAELLGAGACGPVPQLPRSATAIMHKS